MPKNIAVVTNSKDAATVEFANKIVDRYQNNKNKFTFIETIKKTVGKGKISPKNREDFDLALVIGGDGTMLRACRFFGNTNVPLIGINRGKLGFLVDLAEKNIDETLPQILLGKYNIHQRNMLAADVFTQKKATDAMKKIKTLVAVNDIYLTKEMQLSMLDINIWHNKDFLSTIRADGLIVATPTGSTAYAISNGGPIMHPRAQGFVLCAVAPHSLTNRPIVMPDDFELTVRLSESRKGQKAYLCADGQESLAIDTNITIKIYKSSQTFTLAHPQQYNFYHNLRNKLSWNEELVKV